MNRLLLAVLLVVLTLDFSVAQMSFDPLTTPSDHSKATLSDGDKDDFTKRRRKSNRGSSEETDLSLVLSFAPAFVMPMGDLEAGYEMGYGVSIDGYYFIDRIGIGLNSGFHLTPYKAGGLYDGSTRYVPLVVQGAYVFSTSEFMPYAGFGFGIYNVISRGTETVTIDLQNGGTAEGERQVKINSSNFGISPVLGAMYTINTQLMVKLDARLNTMFATEESFDAELNPIKENVTHMYLTVNAGVAFNF